MKLSELLRLRELIDEHTPNNLVDRNQRAIDPLMFVLEQNTVKFPAQQAQLADARKTLLESTEKVLAGISDINQAIKIHIDELLPEYFANSYNLYQDGMQQDSLDHVLNRRISLSEHNRDFVSSRIKLYTDWQRSGMIIRPGLESWVKDLVALDPLYLVDHDHELLRFAISQFTKEYQRRLRPYVVKENDQEDILSALPDAQFGFVLAFNFFHYKPLEVIKRYLVEIYQKLCPGGTLAMTFNDCDRSGAVFLCEQWFMCFTPGNMIVSLAQHLGFHVTLCTHLDSSSCWIELRKPGSKISLRGGQTLSIVRNR